MGNRDSEVSKLRAEIERLEKQQEKRLQAARASFGKLAAFIRPGMAVWYEASPGRRFEAVVDSEPYELGAGEWVVRLRDLGADYREYNASPRTTVPAAATWCLEPRQLDLPKESAELRAIVDPLIVEEKRQLLRGIKRNVDGLDEGEAAVDQMIETTLRSYGQRLMAAYARYITAPDVDLIDEAWGLIANAGGGNWGVEAPEWQTAAARWRDGYHAMLDSLRKGEMSPLQASRDALARVCSAIPNCGPLPARRDGGKAFDRYVDDVIANLARAIHGDKSVSRGREAERLRSGIESLIDLTPDHPTGGDIRTALRRLIDKVEADDSLAFIEKNEQDATRYRRLRVLGVAPGGSLHLENRAVLTFTNLDEFVDGDLRAHPSRGEADEPALSMFELEEERDVYRAMLADVIAGADPNLKSAMRPLWDRAIATLKTGKRQPLPAKSMREIALEHALPGQTVISGKGGVVERVEQKLPDTMDEVHAAHRILIGQRAAELLVEWAGVTTGEVAHKVLPSTDLITRTRYLLEDLSPLPGSPMSAAPVAITEEQGHQRVWYELRPQNLAELRAFVDVLCNFYQHDIFTVLHAMAAGALATARVIAAEMEARMGKISGAARVVPFLFLRKFANYDGPIGIREYRDMLYPQHAADFRTIPLDTFRWVQEQAKKRLAEAENPKPEDGPIAPEVIAHWKKIVDGEVPFGLQIKD